MILRARVPRHISAYFSLKPYNLHEARGLAILVSLGQSHFSRNETYFAHAPLSVEDRPPVILITDKLVIELLINYYFICLSMHFLGVNIYLFFYLFI